MGSSPISQAHTGLVQDLADVPGGGRGNLCGVDRVRRCGRGAGACVVQDRGDPLVHPLGPADHVVEQFPRLGGQVGGVPGSDQVDEPGDRPQRLPQVVADGGGVDPQFPVGPFEFLGSLPDGGVRGGEFVRCEAAR